MIDADAVKRRTDGMLPAAAYEAIYRCAFSAEPGALVEVGAAHGAATIALARGVQDAGRDDLVYSFETGFAMRADVFQNPSETNLGILASNLDAFGVSERVRIVAAHVADGIEQVPALREGPVSLLLIDADGVLDRDFALFYNALRPDAWIIIDDYQNMIDLDGHGYNPLGKLKSTYEYVNFFLEKGLIAQTDLIGCTFFGKKPDTIAGAVELDPAELSSVRERLARERARLDKSIARKRSELAQRPDLGGSGHAEIARLQHIPSMSNLTVLRHLYECSRRHRGVGEAVEIGSWLGASAGYLAAGLRQSGTSSTLHCFDGWKATEYEVRRAAGQAGFVTAGEKPVHLTIGQDLSAIFLNNVVPVYPRVKAARTDLRSIKWCGRPIELLHDDGTKYEDEFRRMLRLFGPSFIPGVTLLILSDYNYWKVRHCPDDQRELLRAQTTIMESLGEYFEMVFDSGERGCAATFLYTNRCEFAAL